MENNEAKYVVFTEIIDDQGFVWHPTVREGFAPKDVAGMFAAMEAVRAQALIGGFKPYIKPTGGFPKKEVKHIEGRQCPLCKGRLIEGTGKWKEKCENNKWDPVAKKNIGCNYIVWNQTS